MAEATSAKALLEKSAADFLKIPSLAIKLVELAPIALVVVVGEDALFHIMNRRAELLTGYERSELYGHPVEQLVPDALKDIHAAMHRPGFFADPHERPMGVGLNLRLRRKNGAEVPVEIELQPIPDAEDLLVMVAIQRTRGA